MQTSRRARTKSQRLLEHEESEKEWKTNTIVKPVKKEIPSKKNESPTNTNSPPPPATDSVDIEIIPSSNEETSIKPEIETQSSSIQNDPIRTSEKPTTTAAENIESVKPAQSNDGGLVFDDEDEEYIPTPATSSSTANIAPQENIEQEENSTNPPENKETQRKQTVQIDDDDEPATTNIASTQSIDYMATRNRAIRDQARQFNEQASERRKRNLDEMRRRDIEEAFGRLNEEPEVRRQRQDEIYVPLTKRIVNPQEENESKRLYLPSRLANCLKPHQLFAVQFCYQNIVEAPVKGCIVAHSMGLGKTLSMISFSYLMMKENLAKRILIVAPKNVLLNWKTEFEKWYSKALPSETVPTIIVFTSEEFKTSADRMGFFQVFKTLNRPVIAIISYNMFKNFVSKEVQDLPELRESRELYAFAKDVLLNVPDLVIADECHIIKNPATIACKSMGKLKTKNRIALTGTPIQNHLMEYYTMINWTRANFWSDLEFRIYFLAPIELGRQKDSTIAQVQVMKRRAYILTQQLKDFVNRVDQSVLRAELPAKHEFVIFVKLNELQRSMYRAFIKTNQQKDFFRNILYYCALLIKVINHPDMLRKYAQRKDIVITTNNTNTLHRLGRQQEAKERLAAIIDLDEDEEEVTVVKKEQVKRETTSSTTVDLDDDLLSMDIYSQMSQTSQSVKKESQSVKNEPTTPTPTSVKKEKKNISTRSSANGNASVASSSSSNTSTSPQDETEDFQTEDQLNQYSLRRMERSASNTDRRRKKKKNEEDDEMDIDDADADQLVQELVELGQDENFSYMIPTLTPQYRTGNVQNSSKTRLLLKIIRECILAKEKILVFSQYTETLDIIEEIFSKTKIEFEDGRIFEFLPAVTYYRIDGKVNNIRKREDMVNEFNREGSKVQIFLISTRAGGVGITLTAASRVVLFDVSFNPSSDQQSLFRAYRYGQTRPVHIYRFVASGTVEEIIWNLQVNKNWLFKKIVDGKDIARLMSRKDLNLYAFDQDEISLDENLDQELYNNDPLVLKKLCEDENWRKRIHSIKEHESLYIDDSEQVTEEEKRKAEEEFKNFKSMAESRNPMFIEALNYMNDLQNANISMADIRNGGQLAAIRTMLGNPDITSTHIPDVDSDVEDEEDRGNMLAQIQDWYENIMQRYPFLREFMPLASLRNNTANSPVARSPTSPFGTAAAASQQQTMPLQRVKAPR